MADYLVLRFLHGSTDTVEWVMVDAGGAVVGEPARGDPIAAAESALDSKVIALVPGASVLRTTVEIPVRGTSKILQALPFAMEEQLATEVDELHFAIGKRDAHDRLAVAVVERLEMEAWLELLAAAGMDPVGLYADSDAVGAIPNTTTLFIEPDSLILRDADGYVAVSELESADTTLDLWFRMRESVDDEDATPAPINLLVFMTEQAQQNPATEAFIASLQPRVASLDIKLLVDGALPRLASQIVAQPGVNLLQGSYGQRSNLTVYWPAWRVAAVLLASLAVTLAGAKILEISSLSRQAAALDTAIEQAIRYTFPEVQQVQAGTARNLLQSKLRGLGSDPAGGNATEFLDNLQAVAGAIADAEGANAKLETINYRSGVMELRVLAPNVEALDAIQRQLVEDGSLEAEIQSANPEGDRVRGRIQVRAPGA